MRNIPRLDSHDNKLEISLLMNTVYYSQTDSLLKRINQTVEIMLQYELTVNLKID